jgi:hypothetical protein
MIKREQVSEKISVIPNRWVQEPKSDEIDLRELMLMLWRD